VHWTTFNHSYPTQLLWAYVYLNCNNGRILTILSASLAYKLQKKTIVQKTTLARTTLKPTCELRTSRYFCLIYLLLAYSFLQDFFCQRFDAVAKFVDRITPARSLSTVQLL